MLFINHEEYDQKFGNSFCNIGEAKVVSKLLDHLVNNVRQNKVNEFGFVSPYQGQVQKLKSILQRFDIDDNIRSIDSWQGREKEIMIFSAVRSNDNKNIGFLNNERRINVALTRA
jgi:superfamily I DNA and/or RNA helicase